MAWGLVSMGLFGRRGPGHQQSAQEDRCPGRPRAGGLSGIETGGLQFPAWQRCGCQESRTKADIHWSFAPEGGTEAKCCQDAWAVVGLMGLAVSRGVNQLLWGAVYSSESPTGQQ